MMIESFSNHSRDSAPHFLAKFSWSAESTELSHYSIFVCLFFIAGVFSLVSLWHQLRLHFFVQPQSRKRRGLSETLVEEAVLPIVCLHLVVVLLALSQIVYFAFGGHSREVLLSNGPHGAALSFDFAQALIGIGESLTLGLLGLLLVVVLKLDFAVSFHDEQARRQADLFFCQVAVASLGHLCLEVASNTHAYHRQLVLGYRVLHLVFSFMFVFRFVVLFYAYPPTMLRPNQDSFTIIANTTTSFRSRVSATIPGGRYIALVVTLFLELLVAFITAALLQDCAHTRETYALSFNFASVVVWSYPLVQTGLVLCVSYVLLPPALLPRLKALFCCSKSSNSLGVEIKTTPPSHSVSAATIIHKLDRPPPKQQSSLQTPLAVLRSPNTSNHPEDISVLGRTDSKRNSAKPIFMFPTSAATTTTTNNNNIAAIEADDDQTRIARKGSQQEQSPMQEASMTDSSPAIHHKPTNTTSATSDNSISIHRHYSSKATRSALSPTSHSSQLPRNPAPLHQRPSVSSATEPEDLDHPVEMMPNNNNSSNAFPSLSNSLSPSMSRSSTRKSGASLGGWLLERQESIKRKAMLSLGKRESLGLPDPTATRPDDVNPVVYVV